MKSIRHNCLNMNSLETNKNLQNSDVDQPFIWIERIALQLATYNLTHEINKSRSCEGHGLSATPQRELR